MTVTNGSTGLVRPSGSGFWSPRTRGGAIALLVTGASMLPYVLAPVRARWLGPEARGAFAFFQSALVVVASCGMLGVRYAAYALKEAGPRRLEVPLRRTVALGVSAAVACALPLAVIASFVLSRWLGAAILLSVLLVPGWIRSQLELANAQLLGLDARIGVSLTGASVTEFLLNFATVVTRTLTLASSVAVTYCAEVARIAIAARWRRRDAATTVAMQTSDEELQVDGREFRRVSRSYAAGAILPMVAANVDILIYGSLMPVGLVGVYSVAKLGFSLYLPVGSVIEGRVLSSIRARGRKSTFSMIVLIGLGLALPLSCGAYILVPRLFGAAYFAAVWALPVACVAGTLRILYGSMLVGSAGDGNSTGSSLASWAVILTTVCGATAVGVGSLSGLLGHRVSGGGLLLAVMMGVLVLAQAAGAAVMGSGRTLKL